MINDRTSEPFQLIVATENRRREILFFLSSIRTDVIYYVYLKKCIRKIRELLIDNGYGNSNSNLCY